MKERYVTLKSYYTTLAFICVFILLYTLTAAFIIVRRDKEVNQRIDKELASISVMKGITYNDSTPETEAAAGVSEEKLMFPNEADSKPLYIIAEYDGVIGIFDGSHTNLISHLDVPLSSLPESDRGYLEEGISVYTQRELDAVIADYTS